MKSSEIQVPDNWILTNFGNKNLFEILGSGITFFENEKDYYSTSSIENDKLIGIEQVITYRNRPSRANMQPVPNSVWFAKMKNTLKVIQTNQYHIDNVIFSTGFCGIQVNNIDCSYLLQVLKSEGFNTKKDNLAEGTTQVAVNNQHIKNIEFLLPCSISEQQKIASILSKLDEAITQTEQLIDKYKKIKEGLMHDLLTRGIDEQGNIRSEETHKFKDSPLGRIPVEWECGTLSTVYDLRTGTTPLRANENYFSEQGYNWAKTLDLNEYYINYTEEKVTDLALARTSLKLMRPSTILVAMYGGWEQIGRTSILNVEAGTNQAIVSLCNPKIQLLSEFTLFFLQENRWRWKQYAVSTRKDPNITKDDVAKFTIAYPKREKEQQDIVGIIQKVHNQIDLYKEQYLKYNLQKSGLMHDLLTGKIRVNNYEEQNEIVSNVNIVPLKAQVHNQHIEDAVLIGAIVNAFYSEKYTLGRKKVQKLLYLLRRHQDANVGCFKKKAAGPYADEVRYKGGEPIAKANKYITTKINNLGTVFRKGENTEKALAYIEKWKMLSDIEWLVAQFKYTKVDQLELIATIDMARCDLEKEGIQVSLSTIKHLIATNEEWKAKLKKDYFDDFSIQRGIDDSYKLFGE